MTTILDEFGKKSPKTDGKAQPFIDGLKELSSSDLPIDVSNIKATDDTFKSFLKTWDGTGDVASKYNKFLESSSNATSSFGSSIKSLGANLLSIGANLIISTLVTKGIELAATAIDNYIHRLDNSKESLSETQSEIESTNLEIEETAKQMEELESLDPSSLSITDKEDLQRLKDQNEELRIRQQYLTQQEQEDLNKVAEFTKEKYNQLYSGNVGRGDIDSYKELYNKNPVTNTASSYLTGESSAQSTQYAAIAQDTGLSSTSTTLANLIAQYEYYSEEKKKAIENKDLVAIEQYNANLEKTAIKLREDRTELQGFSDDLLATGEASPELDEITLKLEMIDNLLLPPGQNLTNFISSESLKNDKEKLVELANSGKLTQEELATNFTEVDKYLKENGLTLEDLISVIKIYEEELGAATSDKTSILSYSDTISQVQSLSKGLSLLNAIYTDIYDKGDFDLSSFLSNEEFTETFGEMGDSYDQFIKTITENPSNIEACQSAFDNLTNSYIYNSKVLDNLTEATKDIAIKILEEKGIVNASAIVTNALAAQKNFLALANGNAAITSSNLADATSKEMVSLLNEEGTLDETSASVVKYWISKQTANGLTLMTDGDISNLQLLVSALGGSTEALKQYSYYKARLSGINNAIDSGLIDEGAAQDKINYYKDKMNTSLTNALADVGNTTQKTNAQYSGGADTKKAKDDSNSGSSPKEAAEKVKEAFYEVFDWMERRISYLERIAKQAIKRVTDSLQYASDGNYVSNTFKKINDQMAKNAYMIKRYQKSANDVGLSSEWKKRVEEGGDIDYSEITDEQLSKNIKAYEDWYKKSLDCKEANEALRDSIKDVAEAMANAPIDKAAEKLEKYESATTLLDAKSKNTVTAKSKNKLNDSKSKNIDSTLSADKQAYDTSKSNVSKYTKKITEQKVASSATKKQKDKYSDLMKKVKAFAKSGKKIDDKTLDAIYDYCSSVKSFTWYENCVAYNASIDAKASAKETYDLYKETAKSDKAELIKKKFDNVSNEYSNKIGLIDHSMQDIENQISIVEAKGQMLDVGYYKKQSEINSQQLAQYQEQKASLESMLPTIQQGTNDWYDAKEQIQDCANAISECEKNTLEYNNAINELNVELFEKVAKQIDRIVSEQELLAKLMSHEKKFDDNGSLTEAGLATLGTYTNSYYANLEKANKDKAELDKLNQMLGNNNLGTFNSVDQLKARIDELYSTWQDDILATYGSQEDIFNMMSDKFDAELNAVKDLIDAKKEALSVEKELYDYQNQIAEKTKSITTLQKRIAAYKGDTSQEGQAKLQKLQVSLQDAQKDLKDTEYEKYISDQEDMLDKLYTDYSETIQKRLEDFQEVVQIGLDTANENSKDILEILGDVSDKNGYKMQYTPDTNSTLQGYVTQITGAITSAKSPAVPESFNPPLNTGYQGMVGIPEPEVEHALSGTKTEETGISTGSISPNSFRASNYISSHVSKANQKKSEYSDLNQALYSKYNGKILSSEELRELAKMLGVVYNGASKTSNLYKKLQDLKISGFSTGGIIRGLKSTISENGDTLLASVNPNETILTEEFTRMLPDAVGVMSQFNDLSFPDYSASAFRNLSSTVGDVQFNFELSGCQNTEEMLREIQQNPKVQRAIQSVTVDQMLGKPRLSVMSIK